MAGGGSRPGERRGGRKPGTPNRRTIGLRAGLVAAGASPEAAVLPLRQQPVDFMLSVMDDPTQPTTTRLAAATAAAPYLHFRKGPVDPGDLSRPLVVQILKFAAPAGELAEEPKIIEHDPQT